MVKQRPAGGGELLSAGLRHPTQSSQIVGLGQALALALLACSCGGGGSSGPPPSSVSVSISPMSVAVAAGASQQFTATVTGTTNTAVTWQVGSATGGNSSLGTISTSGLYKAPNAIPPAGAVTITAVSQADKSRSANSQVTLTSGPLKVTVLPATATAPLGCTQQFTASVTGPINISGVIWSVNGTTGGSSQVGTISTQGLYTPPASVPSPAVVTVAATSGVDPAKSGSASLTVASSNACVTSLSPIVAMQNSTNITVAVEGSGFTSGSQAFFNGATASTTFVSASQLNVTLASADIATAGTFPVTVHTGGASSNTAEFYVVPTIQPQSVSVSAGVESGNVNISVPSYFPVSLSVIALGTGAEAGVTGVQLTQGSSNKLLLVGLGVQPGTFYVVSGNPAEVSITQPVVSDFTQTQDGLPAVKLQTSASASAALGPRNILITNPAGEISVFPGGLLICNSSGVCQ